jgi:hypothetical protein
MSLCSNHEFQVCLDSVSGDAIISEKVCRCRRVFCLKDGGSKRSG